MIFPSAHDAARAYAHHQARRASVGSKMFVTPADIEAMQTRIGQKRTQLSGALGTCVNAGKLKVSDPIFVQWQPVSAHVDQFLAYAPSYLDLFELGSRYDEGEALEKELDAWFPKVSALGCGPVAPVAPAPSSFGLGDLLHGVENVLPWVLAYLLFKEFGGSGR